MEVKNRCTYLGNSVWIGPNAVIVEKINIGDNVLIAANSYVNFDVPSNSIVIGNPGRIFHQQTLLKDISVKNGLKNE
ncbi:LbetaH domain-containing protein [Parabacteroides merdae]|uniref:hypothetical protein n=1 Tax=Parabacteroides merdae TaxID=46503 RepID=UPI0011072975|nr:hypothetical protein [Parabacteroides merdae]